MAKRVFKSRGDFYSTGEVAEIMGVTPQTVWAACRRWKRFAVRLHNHYRVPKKHVQRLLAGEHPREISKTPSD